MPRVEISYDRKVALPIPGLPMKRMSTSGMGLPSKTCADIDHSTQQHCFTNFTEFSGRVRKNVSEAVCSASQA
jgi:hypothetical protein